MCTGVVQTTDESFDDNVESDLDLEFAMALVGAQQNVTLFQTGDLEAGTFGLPLATHHVTCLLY